MRFNQLSANTSVGAEMARGHEPWRRVREWKVQVMKFTFCHCALLMSLWLLNMLSKGNLQLLQTLSHAVSLQHVAYIHVRSLNSLRIFCPNILKHFHCHIITQSSKGTAAGTVGFAIWWFKNIRNAQPFADASNFFCYFHNQFFAFNYAGACQ